MTVDDAQVTEEELARMLLTNTLRRANLCDIVPTRLGTEMEPTCFD